jgi:hypothetical protein
MGVARLKNSPGLPEASNPTVNLTDSHRPYPRGFWDEPLSWLVAAERKKYGISAAGRSALPLRETSPAPLLGRQEHFLKIPWISPPPLEAGLAPREGQTCQRAPALGCREPAGTGHFRYTLPRSETQDLVFLIVLWLG